MPSFNQRKRRGSKRSLPLRSTNLSSSCFLGLSICISSCSGPSVAVSGFSPQLAPSQSYKRRLPDTRPRLDSSSLNVLEKRSSPFMSEIFQKRDAPHHHHQQDRQQQQKQKQQQQSNKPSRDTGGRGVIEEMMKDRTDFEMAVMSTLAITIPTGVILTLAMNGESSQRLTQETGAFLRDMLSLSSIGAPPEDVVNLVAGEAVDLIEDSIEELGSITLNVFDAAVPTTATDVISIALGEGIAAGIGGLVSSLASTLLKTKGKLKDGFDSIVQNKMNFNSTMLMPSGDTSMDEFIADAVADTDYFITRAAAMPILGAVGLPAFLGVLVATLPSQLIKLSARQRQQRFQEDQIMEALLLEEQKRKKGRLTPFFNKKSNQAKALDAQIPVEVPKEITPGLANQVDFVEIFSDITKWLEYEVLINDFNGIVTWNSTPLSPGLESAVFGFLAALSSQLWADVIYRFTDIGPQLQREAARSRSVLETFALYMVRCASAATLFGVYESVRLPISSFITNLLTGGVDSCLGSDDFNLCLETFFVDNPADATVEGEVRAIFVTIFNLLERLDGLDFDAADLPEIIRSLAVQLVSVFNF